MGPSFNLHGTTDVIESAMVFIAAYACVMINIFKQQYNTVSTARSA